MQVAALGPHEFASFRHLTFPVMRHLLDPDRADRPVCVGVRSGEEPVGLALGAVADEQLCELASLHLLPFFRDEEALAELLEGWERAAAHRGCRRAVHFFTARQGDDPAARFFMRQGWSRPTVRNLVCRTTLANAFDTPWLIRARMPDGYRIVSWIDLTTAQRATLIPAEGEAWYPPVLDPFRHEAACDEATSVALLEERGGREQVVGWTINHPLDEVILRWTSSFLRVDLQTVGYIVPMWLEVARRQRAATTLTDFIFSVAVDQPRMARFVTRRMRPWLSDLSFGCVIGKQPAPC